MPDRVVMTPLLRLLVGAAAVVVIVLGLRALAPVLTVFMVAIVVAETSRASHAAAHAPRPVRRAIGGPRRSR